MARGNKFPGGARANERRINKVGPMVARPYPGWRSPRQSGEAPYEPTTVERMQIVMDRAKEEERMEEINTLTTQREKERKELEKWQATTEEGRLHRQMADQVQKWVGYFFLSAIFSLCVFATVGSFDWFIGVVSVIVTVFGIVKGISMYTSTPNPPAHLSHWKYK